MRCGFCRHEWRVNTAWLDRFIQALESCPECATDCQSEDRPNFCAEQNDPAHDDSSVREIYWYHSSVHSNWPNRNFDPTVKLTEVTKQRMRAMSSDGGGLERWAERQKVKALHIGTYESAIENMLRRMRDQDSSVEQFYLYRVQLSPNCVIEPGVHQEPTNFVGDAHLADVCGSGVNTFRYVNTHEDPSSISLAIDMEAIHAVQRISVPLSVNPDDSWVLEATSRLIDAASRPVPLPANVLERMRRQMPSALTVEARRLETEISAGLPLSLRDRFHAGFEETIFEEDSGAFPAKLLGLARLVSNPQAAIDSLDSEPWREV